MERFNAFFVAPQVIQDLSMKLVAPLWDKESIRRHGMRQFRTESKYVATPNSMLGIAEYQRQQVMDWNAINPYLFNGSVSLAGLFPNIRIGHRFRIAGEKEEHQETYYVEQVSHSWSLSGGRTTLGVTRGWIGSEASYIAAVENLAARYVSATLGSK